MHGFYLHIFTCILCALWLNRLNCGYICFFIFNQIQWDPIWGHWMINLQQNKHHRLLWSSVWDAEWAAWEQRVVIFQTVRSHTDSRPLSFIETQSRSAETHTHFPEALNHFHNDDDGGRINTGVPQPLYSSVRQCLDV